MPVGEDVLPLHQEDHVLDARVWKHVVQLYGEFGVRDPVEPVGVGKRVVMTGAQTVTRFKPRSVIRP